MEDNQHPRFLLNTICTDKKRRCCRTCVWAWHKENWNPKFKHLDGEFMCHNPKGIRKGENTYHTVVEGNFRGCREHETRNTYQVGGKGNDI